MNIESFSTWLRRQGFHVYQTASSYWFDAGPRVLQAFPYHWLIKPSEAELRELTVGKGFAALRFSMPMESTEGAASYHVVLSNPYDLTMLKPQARNGVRRGQDHFRVEQISCERMAEEGWLLQQDTLERQGRSGSMKKKEWERICLSAKGLEGFEMWAAISNENELAATILTARIGDRCYVPYAQSHRKFMSLHANNVLFYEASREMLAKEGVREIFFSLHSLDAPESVNEFKFRMGLMAKPVRQRIFFHPFLRPLANDLALKTVRSWQARYPKNCTLAKVEGVLRFYLQGRRPLETQDWPECLSAVKAEMFGAEPIASPGQDLQIQTPIGV